MLKTSLESSREAWSVHHFGGEQHLQRYLNNFAFRYTNRSGAGISNGERAAIAIKGSEGKRLTYRQTH
jgi:hypothetical protein